MQAARSPTSKTCALGEALHEDQGARLNYREFEKRSNTAVRTCDEHNFDGSEMTTFYTKMSAEVKLLFIPGQ